MKKILSVMFLFALLASSCSDEELVKCQSSTSGTVKFTASFEGNESRTYVEKGRLLRWTAGDQISLFNGCTLNRQYQFDGETGDNSGTFSLVDNTFGTGQDLNCNYAVYPYAKDIKITDDTDEAIQITAILPAEQSYRWDSFGIGANTMVAVTKDKDDTFLNFKNVCGYLKLKLYGNNVTVKTITLKGNAGEKIAGKATIIPSYGGEPIVSMADDATETITLDCGEYGVGIGSSIYTATDFWVVVPPISFESGFTITITDREGYEFTQSTSKTISVERNVINTMAALNVNDATVSLDDIYRSMYTPGWSTTANTHQCFGISAYNLMAEVMGDDFVMGAQGLGWFWDDCIYNIKGRYTSSSWRSFDLWNAYYAWISAANYILTSEENKEGILEERCYTLGQAYAIRAYSYYMLAQSFARTYKGHESEPCCPLYTKPIIFSTERQPRSSVQQVYNQIVSDMDKALEYLTGTTRKHISHISYEVALGLRARIALTMEDWAAARTAVKAAIAASSCEIIPVENFMGVNNAYANNVMWAADISADQVGMYASFFSHMSTSVSYGNSARKLINKELYAKMSATDSRLSWWNPNDSEGYQQTKFEFSDLWTWMGDYIWMRIEEMYLIAAEAECRLGDETAAKADLMALMSERDPSYTCENLTGTALGALTNEWTGSLLEEITIQRRIELWGEAGRIYDIRRYKQGFRRTEAQGWPAAALLAGRPTDNPENWMWVLTIPQAEFDINTNMDAAKDQNPIGDQ